MRQAHDGGVAEFDAYRELIVPLKERSVNDAEQVTTVVQPVFVRELSRHGFKLFRKADARLNGEARLKRRGNDVSIFAVNLPRLKRARIFPRARVRHVENVAQMRRVAAIVHKCDALGSAAHIAAHALCPHVVPGASGGIRPLGVD